MQSTANTSTAEKFKNTLSRYSLANISLILPIMAVNGLVQFATGRDSLASITTTAINQTSGTFLLTSAAGLGLMSATKVIKETLAEHKEETKRSNINNEQLKTTVAAQFNTDVQQEIEQLTRQTNNDPGKTLEVAKFRLSLAILDGNRHKTDVYTEVNKRLVAEPQAFNSNSDFSMT